MKSNIMRIAMWSGPRHRSTAMMYSWGNRPDTYVIDEPFYPHYLLHNKNAYQKHYDSQKIIDSYETDEDKVIRLLTEDLLPEGRTIFFQKHMAHHLLDGMRRDWLDKVTNCFLIRDPREVLLSLSHKFKQITLQDTGFREQFNIFDSVRKKTCNVPPVVDATDLSSDPRRVLKELCRRLQVSFNETMLSWKPGPKDYEGIWAKHWYAGAWESTGFNKYLPKIEALPTALVPLYDECMEYYGELYKHRLGQISHHPEILI